MMKYAPLILAAGLMAACNPGNPADPTDPEPLTPPENASTDPLPDTPGADTVNQNAPMEPSQTADNSRQAGSECGTVTADGLCGVAFGMSADEAKDAHIGGLYDVAEIGTEEPQPCYYLGPEKNNYDVAYMVVDGTVQRIDIRAPGVSTSEGVQVGQLASEVEGIYPDLTRQPNKYTDRDNLVVQLAGDAKLVMETDENGLISSYRVGMPPAVDYVEGCA